SSERTRLQSAPPVLYVTAPRLDSTLELRLKVGQGSPHNRRNEKLAKATGVREPTIRFYERRGLLRHASRSSGNCRLYGHSCQCDEPLGGRATMSIALPAPVAAYFAAEEAGDADALARCFAEDGVVRDEGGEFTGVTAIREWNAAARL